MVKGEKGRVPQPHTGPEVPSGDQTGTIRLPSDKDTEALVADGNVPQVDAEVIGRQKGLLIAVY